MVLELFHSLADPESAAVRRRLGELELFDRVELRNVHFDSHREAFESHGGKTLPALWDGRELHEGREAVLNALTKISF